MTPRLLTLAEAAEVLRVSAKTVRRRIEGGDLPAVRLGPRTLRVREDDLQRYIATRVVRPREARVSSSAGRPLAAGERLWE